MEDEDSQFGWLERELKENGFGCESAPAFDLSPTPEVISHIRYAVYVLPKRRSFLSFWRTNKQPVEQVAEIVLPEPMCVRLRYDNAKITVRNEPLLEQMRALARRYEEKFGQRLRNKAEVIYNPQAKFAKLCA